MIVFLIDDKSGHWFSSVSTHLRKEGYAVCEIAKKDLDFQARLFGNAAFDAILVKAGTDAFCVVTDATFDSDSNGASGGSLLLHRLHKEATGFRHGIVYSEYPECKRVPDRIEALVQDQGLHKARALTISRFFKTGRFRPLSGLHELVNRLGAVLKCLSRGSDDEAAGPWIEKVEGFGKPTLEAQSAKLGVFFKGMGHDVPRPFSLATQAFFEDDVYHSFANCFPNGDARRNIVRDILGPRDSLDIASKAECSVLLNGDIPGALRVLWDMVMCGGDSEVFKRDYVPDFTASLNDGQRIRYSSVLSAYQAILATHAVSVAKHGGWPHLYGEVMDQWALLENAMQMAKGDGIFQ